MAPSNAQDFSDNAMLELFRAEVESHTQALNEGLLALEKEPGQLRLLESLMRAAHSIKGAARIVGIEDGVRVSHALEDCLVAAQNGQVTLTSTAIDILLRGVDAIVRIAGPDQAVPPSRSPRRSTGCGAAWGPSPAEFASSLNLLLQDIAGIRQGKPRGAKKPFPEQVDSALSPQASAPSTLVGVAPIAVVKDGNVRTFHLPGNLDDVAAERLRLAMLEAFDAGDRDFRFDLAAVREVDVTGLALLSVFGTMVREQAQHGALELINVGQDAAALFRLTGVAGLYRLEAKN